jgi:folylpolyglutamate synthase/dihydropteroate synthase
MLAPLASLGAPIVLARTPGERGVDPARQRDALPAGTRARCVDDPVAALRAARVLAGAGAPVLVSGSLHLVGRLLGRTTA